MAMSLQDAITALKTHARQQEAVQVLAAELASIDVINQRRTEAEALVKEAQRRQAEEQAKVDDLCQQVASLTTDATAALEAHCCRAQRIVDDAHSEASSLRAEAGVHLERAKVEADKLRSGALAFSAEKARDTADKQALLDDLGAKIEKKAAELDDLQRQIDRVTTELHSFIKRVK